MAAAADHIPVTLEVARPEELLVRTYPNGKLGGLVVDGLAPGNSGQRVELTVKVKRPAREFHLRGQINWARRKGSAQLPVAYGIDLEFGDDATVERMFAFARRELTPDVMRAEARLQVELPARVLHQGRVRNELVADLSPGGAFIRTWDPLPLGEFVQLIVRPPRALFTISLAGRVAWVRKTGAHLGMGIEFVDTDAGQQQKIDKLLTKMQARR